MLLDHLPEIERAIAFICRRNRLYGADADDFGAWAKLRLIENDYSIIRKFEGRCEFNNFIFVVIHRLLFDYRDHVLGRWRPSAEAKRLGATAVAFEKLTHRDERSFEEAVQILERQGATRSELQALQQRLPKRDRRPREIALEELKVDPLDREGTIAATSEDSRLARSTADAVRRAVDAMPDDDRVILRLRFEAQMSIPEIARMLHVEAKPLYRRINRSLAALRNALERAGVSAADVEHIIDSTSDELDFGLTPKDTTMTGPSGEGVERNGMS